MKKSNQSTRINFRLELLGHVVNVMATNLEITNLVTYFNSCGIVPTLLGDEVRANHVWSK